MGLLQKIQAKTEDTRMAVSASSGCFAPPVRGICCTPGAIISKALAPRAAAFLTALLVSLPQLRPTRTAAFLKGIGAPPLHTPAR